MEYRVKISALVLSKTMIEVLNPTQRIFSPCGPSSQRLDRIMVTSDISQYEQSPYMSTIYEHLNSAMDEWIDG